LHRYTEGRFVWSTSTSYKEKKVPLEFRKYQMNKRIFDINKRAAVGDLQVEFSCESAWFQPLSL
jgi:hypothetical protein